MQRNELLFAEAKANFQQMPKEIFLGVKAVADKHGALYVPHDRATMLGVNETRFGLEPRSQLDGRLQVVEITSLLFVHNEARLLMAEFARGGEAGMRVREMLKLTLEDWPGKVIEGMADFVQAMGYVAGVREWIGKLEGKKPVGNSMWEKNLRYWWDHFVPKIVADDFLLGSAVSYELVEVLKQLAAREVTTPEEIKKWDDYARGAELAASLYLAVLSEDLERLLA